MLISIAIRNEIIAYKQEALMHQMGEHPHIATFIGSGHAQIEDAIQSSQEDRLKFLQTVKPLIKTLLDPKSVYQIAKMEYKLEYGSEDWEREIIEIPELKELVS